ncbi:MAG: FadR/GntR family transcriptional regulator [Acidobacteriaceae bacterium]|nr:FadR/GntR family transcriptional regulator [Acidobacteriaceae bacterium]
MDPLTSGAKVSPFSIVRSTRAHEQIVEQLQHAILSGKLAPGSRLPSERAMMVEFQVSRPTVREALRVAENIGLISVRPGDPGGSKVLGTPSVGIARVFDSLLQTGCTSALELLEMRVVLDSSAAALASTQPKSHLSGLHEALRKMQATTDLHSFAEQDANFHEAVIVASGNRIFHLVFQALNEPIRTMIENTLRSSEPRSREETLQQHAAIVEAIQKGEAHQAACAVRSHLREFYLPILPAQDRRHLKSFLQAMER